MLKPVQQNEGINFPTQDVTIQGCSGEQYWCANSVAICYGDYIALAIM